MNVKMSNNYFLLLTPMFLLWTASIFGEVDSSYVPIAGNNVNLRAAPSLESEAIASVSYGVMVKVIQRSATPETIGGHRGFWTPIETTEGKKLWIFDQFLGLPEHFEPVTQMRYRQVKFCIGDYCPTIYFSPTGIARHRLVSCLGGDCTVQQHIQSCQY